MKENQRPPFAPHGKMGVQVTDTNQHSSLSRPEADRGVGANHPLTFGRTPTREAPLGPPVGHQKGSYDHEESDRSRAPSPRSPPCHLYPPARGPRELPSLDLKL